MDQVKTKNTKEEVYTEYIEQLIKGDSWKLRALAATKLGNFKNSRATSILIESLRSEKDLGVINRIIEALGKIKDHKATAPIIEFLKKELSKKDPNATTLYIVIESLFKIGDKKALTELGVIQDSCSTDIRKMTEKALQCIDPNWKEHIA